MLKLLCIIVIIFEVYKMIKVDMSIMSIKNPKEPLLKEYQVPFLSIDIVWLVLLGIMVFRLHFYFSVAFVVLLSYTKLKLTRMYTDWDKLRIIQYVDSIISIIVLISVIWRIRWLKLIILEKIRLR